MSPVFGFPADVWFTEWSEWVSLCVCVCVALTSVSGFSVVVGRPTHASFMMGCPGKLSESHFPLNILAYLYQDTHRWLCANIYTSFEECVCVYLTKSVEIFTMVHRFVFLHIPVKVITCVCERGGMSVSSIFLTHCTTVTALGPQISCVCVCRR